MRNITALIKPASDCCNLKCEYCFYRDEASSRTGKHESMMTEETAINLIDKVYAYAGKGSEINFMFQGGEPLLRGHEFFEFFSSEATSRLPGDSKVLFSIQTNGTLINEDFCAVFKKYNYLVGVSVDGNKETHNRFRSNSFDKAKSGIEQLKDNKIDFRILTVVTLQTDATELYSFYKENNFDFTQLIYCLDPLDGKKSEYSLDALSLARFKKRFFNKWFNELKSGNRFNVREFENLAMYVSSGEYEQCGFLGECTPQLVVEADGTVYPCDFYCLDEFLCPNINEASLDEIVRSQGVKSFLGYTEPVNELCSSCPVSDYCGGGCKRYRSLYNSVKGYCPQRDFLMHALDKLIPYLEEDEKR